MRFTLENCGTTITVQLHQQNDIVCGPFQVFPSGVRCLRPGGCYVLVGMVHPRSQLDVTGEIIIRKCLAVIGASGVCPCYTRRSVSVSVRKLHSLDEAVRVTTREEVILSVSRSQLR